MGKIILVIFLISQSVFSQDNITGKKEVTVIENGILKKKTVITPAVNSGINKEVTVIPPVNSSVQGNNTNVRWSFTDPLSTGDFCKVSENGNYNAVSWNLNTKRISLCNNLSNAPLWEFSADPNTYLSFISVSDTGGVTAAGSYHNIYLFNNSGNVPFFNFDLTRLADTGIATGLDVTSDGRFIVCSVSREDSSTIFGFNSSSTSAVWAKRIAPSVTTGGGSVEGVRMSGNDSLVIVNTYAEFFVFRTYTGELIHRGLINPGAPANGTQATMGISGNGSIIATVNYSGFLRVYQWNGTSYVFLWGNQEPPGSFYNWYTSVDISYDGQYVAAGTLNFLSSSTFDGKVKVFKTSGSGTPLWTYAGCGDEITAVSFSKNADILAASSYGEFSNSTEDLYLFKTLSGNTPFYKLNTPGSLFYCSISGNGRTVTASGKAVHARQFGLGGVLYNIDVDTSGTPVSVSNNSILRDNFILNQNYPNPFNPKTVIRYVLPSEGFVTLKIYDALGNEVSTLINKKQNQGSYEVVFDATALSSGVYFYRLESGGYSDVKKFVLMK